MRVFPMPSLKMLPYGLPMLLTTIFLVLSGTPYYWVFGALMFVLGLVNRYSDTFNPTELAHEYSRFHLCPRMAIFKVWNGVFFVLFNVWTCWFCLHHDFNIFSYAVFIYSIIVINSSFCLSLAHDLMHSSRAINRLLANILMLQNGFFYLEYDHHYIHHRHVCTVSDPASAALGEPLYPYLWRSISSRANIIFSRKNLQSHSKKQQSRQQWAKFKGLLCLSLLFAAFFWNVLLGLMIFCQFVFVILLYETTTYIQHYGLNRQLVNGHPEKTGLQHSWNSFDRLYNYLYFFLPVHSPHHANMGPEQWASSVGPVMPYPFPRMVMLAFMPKRWFAVMNPLVIRIQADERAQNAPSA